MHDGCARKAAALCPAPAKVNARIVPATRTQITTRGDIAVEFGMVQTWRLDFRPAAGSSEPTLRSATRNAAGRTPHAAEDGTGE